MHLVANKNLKTFSLYGIGLTRLYLLSAVSFPPPLNVAGCHTDAARKRCNMHITRDIKCKSGFPMTVLQRKMV